ncbi:MAG: ankyrin repeat domain-containing protein, partial [Planctomycetota bacterium]
DLNAKDSQGRTALYLAAERGNKELLELLIKKGADVNVATMRGENAFSLAKSRGNTEMVDLLAKNGGTDPVVQLGYEDEYYGAGDGMAPGRPGAPAQGGPIRGVAATAAPQVDLLADPNEITARLKTFEGLEQTIVGLAKKSATEMKYWATTRYDNRTSVARAVQKQVEDELAVVKKIAVEEKGTKTVEAIDALVKQKQERYGKVSRELMQQKREAQGQSGRGGRGRSSGRSRGGRSSAQLQGSGGAMAGGGYEEGGAYGYGTAGTARGGRSARPAEQLDRATQDEIRQWTQASLDNKADLAKAVYPQIHDEFAVIRQVAVDEEAKKTTAAIDGILLARQVRLDVYVKAADALRAAGAAGQTQGTAGRYGDQTARTTGGRRGRTTRGGATQQQNTQRGGRTRRR